MAKDRDLAYCRLPSRYHKTKEDTMSWALFGQIVLLIVIFAVAMCFVKCMHDSHCKKCKTP